MSKYIPQAAVAKENYMQMVRRTVIEKKHAAAIKGFQELLKDKSTVLPAMRALGLTANHALSLEMRLQWMNEQAAEEEQRKAAHAEKLAALKAEGVGSVETPGVKIENPEVPPGQSIGTT